MQMSPPYLSLVEDFKRLSVGEDTVLDFIDSLYSFSPLNKGNGIESISSLCDTPEVMFDVVS